MENASQVKRVAIMTPEIGEMMAISRNGWSVDDVAALVESGAFLLFSYKTAHAILSVAGGIVTLEAIESHSHGDGVEMTRALLSSCRDGGYPVVSWSYNIARARLGKRCGFVITGETRTCANGVSQIQLRCNHESR